MKASVQVLDELVVRTPGKGFTNITQRLNDWVALTRVSTGIVNLYAKHTSCSLTINENADPRVLSDLAAWMDAVVPQDGRGPLDGAGHRHAYRHDDEGLDDMPAHIRTALTAQTITLSVENARLVLGVWQAVYLWEHRRRPHQRRVLCHLLGEPTPLEAKSKLLNQQIQARHDPEAWAADGGIETEVDLMVDQLHELADT